MNTEVVKETKQNERTRSARTYSPAVDIAERDDALVLYADMPGVKPGAVDIDFENGTLTLRAKAEERQPEQRYLHREFGIGDFYRVFEVSETIDAGKISAEYANGVLKLTLPKAEAARPRKIQVKTA